MQNIRNNIVPVSLLTLTSIAVTIMLHLMKPVLVPFVFALVLYFVSSPVVEWFQIRLKFPKALASSTTLMLIFMLLVFLITILGVSLKGFIQSSDLYQLKLLNLLDHLIQFLESYQIHLDLSIIRQTLLELPLLDWAKNISGSVVTIVGNILLIFVFTFFLVVGNKPEDAQSTIINLEVKHRIIRYLTTKFFTSSLTGTLVGIVLLFFQVQLAIMFAVLTFLLNFIPNIGSLVAIILPLPVVYLQYGFSWHLLLVMSITAVIQFYVGNILDPKLMGENLGLHPVMVLLCLLFWGFIWGLPGLFLAVPMTAVFKLIFKRYHYTKPISDVLEGKFHFEF